MQSQSIVRGRIICAISALAVAAILIPAAVHADEIIINSGYGPRDRFSLGLMLGGPTGIMLEKNLPSGNAWDLGLGVVYGPGLRLHGDYLWTVAASIPDSSMFIRFQIGVGGLVGTFEGPCEGFYGAFDRCNGDIYVGARVPFAVEFWPRAPVVFGLEIAPAIEFNRDGAGGFLDAFVFVRFVQQFATSH